MHRTILSEKPSCRSVSAHTRPAAPVPRAQQSGPTPQPSLLHPGPWDPPLTCTHNKHISAASMASARGDALGHHLGPSLLLQSLGVTETRWTLGFSYSASPSLFLPTGDRTSLLPALYSQLPLATVPLHCPSLSQSVLLTSSTQATHSPACWLGHTPSPSQFSPARTVLLRTRFGGALTLPPTLTT